jgi:hypothetical protein
MTGTLAPSLRSVIFWELFPAHLVQTRTADASSTQKNTQARLVHLPPTFFVKLQVAPIESLGDLYLSRHDLLSWPILAKKIPA